VEPLLSPTPAAGGERPAKRWDAHAWLLVVLAGIVLVAGVGVARRCLERLTPARAVFIPDSYQPTFREGDTAPDFAFADRTGRKRRLSELVRGDTLLWFTCGCSRCRELQVFMDRLARRLGKQAPAVISVTSGLPEAEDAYRRDVPLGQVILYGEPASTIWQRYRGHPCPRVFRLNADRTVAWIGPSPGGTSPKEEALALADALGVDRAAAEREYQVASTR
jgi:hypothetical protein